MPKQNKATITAHMVVKNEDRFVWYAIMSVLPYVDRFLITDTGSSDRTIELIQSIKSEKIRFNQVQIDSPEEITAIRQQQLEATKTDWIWIVDGDEVYPQNTAREVLACLESWLAGIWVRRYDCLGDIYHYQPDERVGGYDVFGKLRHVNLRLINRHIPSLIYVGIYPNEGLMDDQQKRLVDYPRSKFRVTSSRYLHLTYLRRSSVGKKLKNTFSRAKYKIELGKKIPPGELPEVFNLGKRPSYRSILYQLQAILITPIKMVKRWWQK